MVKIISNTWVKEELSREIFKYFELNENENIIYQNLWEAAKGVLRRNFTSLNVCLFVPSLLLLEHLVKGNVLLNSPLHICLFFCGVR